MDVEFLDLLVALKPPHFFAQVAFRLCFVGLDVIHCIALSSIGLIDQEPTIRDPLKRLWILPAGQSVRLVPSQKSECMMS